MIYKMNKKSILAIERIITYITELEIITKGRDDIYFYNGFEMPILCDLVDKIDKNLSIITPKIKIKYSNIKWNVIDSRKEDDNGFKVLKLRKIWELASGTLKKELYENLNNILKIEIPVYYTKYCNKQHKKAANRKENL